MSDSIFIGTKGSHVRFEPPDLAIGTYVGEVTPEDQRDMFEQLRIWCQGKPYMLTLVDLGRAEPFSAETRKQTGESGKNLPVRGTAVIGASFHMRMLATLLTKVLNVFDARSERESPVRFFAGEAEARAWLAERRKAVQQEVDKGAR